MNLRLLENNVADKVNTGKCLCGLNRTVLVENDLVV